MIPKKVHYIWLGGGQKSTLTELCINSWKRVLRDYEIHEWNESNLDIRQLCKEHKFLRECMKLKLWAFASDWLRLYILYSEGGIYLDTDIEVLKSYDELLDNRMFVGLEDNDYIGTGVIGAEPGNPTIKRLLDFYEHEIWNVDFINNPIIFKYLRDLEPEEFDSCLVLSQEVLSPYVPSREYKGTVETGNTLSIHWYSQNWNMSRRGYVFMTTKHISNPFVKACVSLKKNLGYELRKLQ